MKSTQIAIFTILAITATIKAAPVAACAGTTSTYCLSCNGTACTKCAMGFPTASGTDVGKCKVQATPVTGCAIAENDTNCTMCNMGLILASATSCVSPTTPITGCAWYRGTAASPICTGCATGKFPSGNDTTSYSASGVVTLAGCADAAPGGQTLDTNCAYHTVSNAQNTGTAAAYTIACAACKATFYKNGSGVCTTEGTTRVGCAEGTADTCSVCHPTHQ